MLRPRLLLDANISPETAIFLRSFGWDVKSLIEEGLGGLEDSAVARIAAKEKRTLITFDLDFGEIYYFSAKKSFSAIVLRLEDQRVEAVNASLERFLAKYVKILRERTKRLVILTETEIRVVA